MKLASNYLKLLLTFSMISVFSIGFSQSFDWVQGFQGVDGASNQLSDILIDQSGSIFMTGSFMDELDLDPGSNSVNVLPVNFYSRASFVVELDSSGNYLSHWEIKSTGDCHISSITSNSSGDLIVVGDYNQTIDLDPGTGTYLLQSNGSSDIFIAAYTTSGSLLWGKSIGGSWPGGDFVSKVIVDSDDNIYLTGNFSGTVDFDPGSGTHDITATGRTIYLLKLDASGNFGWVNPLISNGGNQKAFDLEIDGESIFLLGGIDRAVWMDFYPNNSITDFTYLRAYNYNSFLQEIDSSGAILNVIPMHMNAYQLEISSTGDFILAALETGPDSVDLNNDSLNTNIVTLDSNWNSLVYSMNANGVLNWHSFFGANSWGVFNKMDLDPNDNVLYSSYFYNQIDVDPGSATMTLTSAGWGDIYINKLSSTGSYLWSSRIGGTGFESPSFIHAVDEDEFFLGGRFGEQVDFDPGTSSALLTGDSADLFLMKYKPLISNTNDLLEANTDLTIYPNPSNSIVTVNISSSIQTDHSNIRIIDLAGREVYSTTLKGHSHQLDVSGFKAGIYTLRVTSENNDLHQQQQLVVIE